MSTRRESTGRSGWSRLAAAARRGLWPLLLIGLAACDDSPGSPDLSSPLTVEELRAHLEWLADDQLRGRRAGSDDERRAADYIRDRLAAFGLEPGVPGYWQSFEIPVPVAGQLGLSSQNVIAVLPGTGSLATQWVVVGAHYDHIGFLQEGDSLVVFNGADDNASGTSLLLEVARVMSGRVRDDDLAGRDRRSVMFQAYGAEEVGLIGSFHFCGEPTVSLDSVVAMMNFDMVGRFGGNGLFLIGTSSSPDWSNVVAGANDEGLSIAFTETSLNRSDQLCFYQSATPVIFFHTGLHSQYHTPLDDVELIDLQGMVSVGDLAVDVLIDLLTRPDPPQFRGGTPPTVGVPGGTP